MGRKKSVHTGGVSTVVGCPLGEVLLYRVFAGFYWEALLIVKVQGLNFSFAFCIPRDQHCTLSWRSRQTSHLVLALSALVNGLVSWIPRRFKWLEHRWAQKWLVLNLPQENLETIAWLPTDIQAELITLPTRPKLLIPLVAKWIQHYKAHTLDMSYWRILFKSHLLSITKPILTVCTNSIRLYWTQIVPWLQSLVFVRFLWQPNILIYFLAFLASVTASPAATNGPTDMSFGMEVCFHCGMLIFEKLGPKVKGQGQISMKIRLFWANLGHRGYVWD